MFELNSSNLPNDIKTAKSLELLGIEVEDNKEEVLNELSMYLFDTSQKGGSGDKIFDLVKDFNYYYVDFLKFGIDLNEDDISWWKFNAVLDGIFLQEKTCIGKVIEYRTWEKPSKNGERENLAYTSYMRKMRVKYALDIKKDTTNNLQTLFDSVKAKSKSKGE